MYDGTVDRISQFEIRSVAEWILSSNHEAVRAMAEAFGCIAGAVLIDDTGPVSSTLDPSM